MPYADREQYNACCRAAGKRWYRRNHAAQLERARLYRAWNSAERARKQRLYTRRKLREDPTWRLRNSMQIAWKSTCRRAGVYHSKPFLHLIGCNWEQFCTYLERKFTGDMSFETFGETWWIDHLYPVSCWNLRRAEDRAMCCHWRNLRPLSPESNRRKNGRFSKSELAHYRVIWRLLYSPKPPKQQRLPF